MHRFLVLVGCIFSVASAGYQPNEPMCPNYPDAPASSLPRCDQNVIAAIQQYWWNYGMPQNIIQTAINNGKEVVVETTLKYYPDNVGCVYSYFSRSSANSASCFIRSISKYGNGGQDKTITVVESKGTTYDPASMIRRYHVLYQSGVTAIYACSESQNAQYGAARGFIKVSEDGFQYSSTPQIIEYHRNVLRSIGVNIQTFYGWSCPPNKGYTNEW